jgi:aminoglycoside phosphotransferase (APT) family kinase protein
MNSAKSEWRSGRLKNWISVQLGVTGELEIKPLPVGISNEMFMLSMAGQHWLLRKPPANISHQSAHNVLREYRVIETLAQHNIRVPRLLAACEDLSIIGTPFYLMDQINAVSVNERISDLYTLASDSHQGFGVEMMNALVELHRLDYKKVGLENIGSGEHFLDSQVDRWLTQYYSRPERNLPHIEAIAHYLRQQCPVSQRVSIIHGDYKLDNLLFSRQPPARVIAIVDWEMATLGDPLLDLGSALAFWPEAGNPIAMQPARRRRKINLQQLPSAQALAEYYASAMNCSVEALNYYMVLALWRRAIILQSRYLSKTGDTLADELADYIPGLLNRAFSLLERS